MSRRKQPQLLQKSISSVLRNLGIESRVKEYQVIAKWPALVGKRVANATSAVRVADGILFVKVKNSVWRNELIYLKRDLFKKIDKEVGMGVIKDIRYI
ncbi:MAG: DciA family protein [bacterium]